MKVAILNVATGKYINFVEQLHNDIREKFMINHDVSFFLFTDNEDKEFPDDVSKYYVERKGFPGDTLYRYHYFLLAKEKLKEYDFLFYLDVDMKILKEIGEEVVGDMVACLHPGFYKQNNGTFERRNQSKAFLPANVTYPYFCGGVQGGKPEHYLKACMQIKDAIDEDDKNQIMAIWHDESHWNAYLHINRPQLKALNPTYCYYPFPWMKQYEKYAKIQALDKNHEEIRK